LATDAHARAAERLAGLYPPGFAAGTALAAYGVASSFIGVIAAIFAIAVAWPEWAAGVPPWRAGMGGFLDLTALPMAVAGALMVRAGFGLRHGSSSGWVWVGALLPLVPLAGACWLLGAPLGAWCLRGCAANAERFRHKVAS
jgi:hypothetical protein